MSDSPPTPLVRRKRAPAGPVVYLDDGDLARGRLRLLGMVLAPIACVLIVWGLWPMDESAATAVEDSVLATPSPDAASMAADAAGFQILDTSWGGERDKDDAEAVPDEVSRPDWNLEAEANEEIRKRFKSFDIAIREH